VHSELGGREESGGAVFVACEGAVVEVLFAGWCLVRERVMGSCGTAWRPIPWRAGRHGLGYHSCGAGAASREEEERKKALQEGWRCPEAAQLGHSKWAGKQLF
jgi:hypothetical protein